MGQVEIAGSLQFRRPRSEGGLPSTEVVIPDSGFYDRCRQVPAQVADVHILETENGRRRLRTIVHVVGPESTADCEDMSPMPYIRWYLRRGV